MAVVRPFKAVRPAPEAVSRVASLPYDVYSREEAAAAVKGKPLSFLNIDRPETMFEPDHDMYAPEVYRRRQKDISPRKGKAYISPKIRPVIIFMSLPWRGGPRPA